jgi:hypothetical protein
LSDALRTFRKVNAQAEIWTSPIGNDAIVSSRDRVLTILRGVPPGHYQNRMKIAYRRHPEITAGMRSTGLSLQVIVDVRMDQDQMELGAPARLSRRLR